MCAIVGSFDREMLLKLVDLNSYRGSHSYSYSTFDSIGLVVHKRAFGAFDKDIVKPNDEYTYHIAHIQAPTTDAKSLDNIHPANVGSSYLWHNGIIKANHVAKMQKELGVDSKWDTELLLHTVNRSIDGLNTVDGTFSCLWVQGIYLMLFRNEISPLFVDADLNISSTKFENSTPTTPNTIIQMVLSNRVLYNIGEFKTVENPYYFGDDN